MKEGLLARRAHAIAAAKENPEGYESVEMSIDGAGAMALMANLTNFYSDAPLAVVREYLSNALDSHRRAGQSKPVLVTIPDAQAKYADEVIIEDFGVGMSKAEIIDVYSKFGASTKGEFSTEIGKFGLGAKSALAAANHFDIVATKDGITTRARVKKNAAGVGKFFFTSEEHTGAPSGVKITIPVEARSAYRPDALKWFFLGLSPQEVQFVGNPIRHTSVHDAAEFHPVKLTDRTVAWVATRERSDVARSQLHVNVGGVHYEVNIGYLKDKLVNNAMAQEAQELLRLQEYGRMVVLNAPLSSVTLHPAREDFIYDSATVKALGALAVNTNFSLLQDAQARLNRAVDHAAALALVLEQRTIHLPGVETLTYRGEPVPTSVPSVGWFSIPTTLSNAKVKGIQRGYGAASNTHISAVRLGSIKEYGPKGKELTSKVIPFSQQRAIRVRDAGRDDVDIAQRQLMKTFEELEFPDRRRTANIWFTAPDAELDPWAAALFTEEITFEQLRQRVRDEQARRRAAGTRSSAKATGGDGVRFAVVQNRISYARPVRGRDDWFVIFLTAAEIRALNKPVIVSHRELKDGFGFAAPSEKAGQSTVSDWGSAIAFARHYRPAAAIVLMPQQTKASTLPKRFPGFELLSDVVLGEAKRIEEAAGQAHVINGARQLAMVQTKYRLASVCAYASRISEQQLDRVRQEDTRHWLATLQQEAVEGELGEVDARLLEACRHQLAHSAARGELLLEGWRKQAERYPLLPLDVHPARLEELGLDDFVLYVNAVDAVR